MAARIGQDPSFLVTDPIKAQLLAAGLGGVAGTFAHNPDTPGRTAIVAALPLLLTQFLRRREIKKIQEAYDTEKRKRLRELDTDELFGGIGGSARLGAVSAYEAMRKRKYQDIGSLSEAGDALALTVGPAHLPITSFIDHRSADRLQKQADFTDQANVPVIPLYLAAALASSGGLEAARAWARKITGDPLPRDQWGKVVHHVSGLNPLIVDGGDMRSNAAYYHPAPTDAHAAGLLNHLQANGEIVDDQTQERRWLFRENPEKERRAMLLRLVNHGAVLADSKSDAATIAHEGGHAKIENTPGVLQFLQRHLYPYSDYVAPLAGVGSMAAGLASGSALKGALLGTGIGLLGGAGTVAPEIGASYYGLKGLQSYNGGALSGGNAHPLAAALSTYLASIVLPSTLAGAAGGFISGRRKKKRLEAEKSAALTPEHLREVERIAAKIGRSMGPDARDRYAMEHAGSVFSVLKRRIANMASAAPAVAGQVAGTTAQPPITAPHGLLRQVEFPFMKRSADGVISRMREAKQHSDAKRYNHKHRILRAVMSENPGAFVVDSDDGNGIVGVTHVKTGFRFHIPKQKLPPGVGNASQVEKDAISADNVT
jgi:hypothetical protein